MKRMSVLFLLCAVWGAAAAVSTNATTAAASSTNEVSVVVRNPFWPIGYTGEVTRISAEMRPKPKPKPPAKTARKDTLPPKSVVAGGLPSPAAANAEKKTADKVAATNVVQKVAKPREIISEDWHKAQRAIKFGNPALFKAEDGTVRSSININGNIYVDGDLMSFTHDGIRFTWRIQGLNGKDKKLKLKRVQARLIEQPKKEEPKKAGGGK